VCSVSLVHYALQESVFVGKRKLIYQFVMLRGWVE